MAASLLSESAGDEPTASVVVGAGLAIARPVMSWKGRFNSKILLKLAKSIAQMANCPPGAARHNPACDVDKMIISKL